MIKLERELLRIAQELLNCWLKNVYSNMDIFELYMEISHLIYNLPNKTYEKDLMLAQVMTEIESQYKIPLLGINIPNWLQKNYHNKFILEVYEKISNLRSI